MCAMLVVLFYLHQQKENYRMMGAFTRKSLVKVESKRKRKKKRFFKTQTGAKPVSNLQKIKFVEPDPELNL